MSTQEEREIINSLRAIEVVLRELAAHARAGSEALIKIEHRYASMNMGEDERAVVGARGAVKGARRGY